jgi:hypothetical protein
MTIPRLTTIVLIMGLFSFLGGAKTQVVPNSPATQQQKISAPSPADLERLARQRAVVEAHLADEDSRAKYTTAAGKLGLLRVLLTHMVFKPPQTYELQCMGIVLGDVFVQELGMEWVTVEDEHGTDPALRLPGTSILIFPLTMISKRVERGESVDVFAVFNGFANHVEELQKELSKKPAVGMN